MRKSACQDYFQIPYSHPGFTDCLWGGNWMSSNIEFLRKSEQGFIFITIFGISFKVLSKNYIYIKKLVPRVSFSRDSTFGTNEIKINDLWGAWEFPVQFYNVQWWKCEMHTISVVDDSAQ